MKFIILRENFEIHNTLNKKLFDDNNKLKPEIKDKLIEIADNFVSFIKDEEVPLKVYDYWLVGSNASYNYNKDSDIDVHIIVDMDSDKIVPGLLQLLYNYMKSSFNKNYDIKVKGQDVELYVEDINTSAITNGIYSLQQDKWIKVPKKLNPILTNITVSEGITKIDAGAFANMTKLKRVKLAKSILEIGNKAFET